MKPKISIVIPAHNEGDSIRKNLEEFVQTFTDLELNYEIVVVDDGSTDNTYEEACKVDYEHVKVLTYPKNEGKGNALNYGVQHATGDFVTFIDADMELHPRQIKTFMEYMERNGADIVVGSKRHPDSKVSYPLERRILSLGYQEFIKLLFGLNVRDTQTGFKFFKREVIQEVMPKVLLKRWAYDLEFLAIAHHLGYHTVEAPIELDYQFNGTSIKWSDVWWIFYDTCAVFYRLYILKYYDRVGEED